MSCSSYAATFFWMQESPCSSVEHGCPIRTLLSTLAHIPDFLFPLVCIITGIAWIAYLYLAHKGIHNTHARFFQLVAISVSLTFFLESTLKYAVGGINTRFWLHHPASRSSVGSMEPEPTTVFPQYIWPCSRSSLSPCADFIRNIDLRFLAFYLFWLWL